MRRKNAAPERPDVVVRTYAELDQAWSARDSLYAERLSNASLILDSDQVQLIRQQRAMEAGYIEPTLRAQAYDAAMRWVPPVRRRLD